MTTVPNAPSPDADDTPLTTDDVPDEIVRTIRIAASAETVWSIVSEPGWFINDGGYRAHEIEVDGDVARVTDPVHGTFELRTDVLEPPRRVVMRWLGGDPGALADTPANIVEFTLEPDGDGVLLTVRETGFASLDADAVTRRRRFEANDTGWVEELTLARTLAEQGGR